jgi:hypothetical protein
MAVTLVRENRVATSSKGVLAQTVQVHTEIEIAAITDG